MENKNLIVHKPNQTIMFTNGEITATQRKAYNVILHKAWNALKVDSKKSVFEFELKELKDMAGIKSTENWQLKRDISKIRDMSVETVFDNGDWSVFSLISSARKKGNFLEVELPIQIREALLENNFYTTLDMMTIKSLEGKYSVILYEMAIRYQKAKIPEMTVQEFRQLTGIENKKGYNNFSNIEKKILTPAIQEINSDKTDIILEYTTTTRGKKTVSIKFTVKPKTKRDIIPAYDEVSATLMPGQLPLVAESDAMYEIKQILEPIGVDTDAIQKLNIDMKQLEEYVSIIAQNHFKAKNPTGVLIYALKNKIAPKSLIKILNGKEVKSNRDNFEQREYSDEYWATFFDNKQK